MDTKSEILHLFPGEKQLEQLFDWELVEWYYQFLADNNEAGGFFSKKDSEHIVTRHLAESAYHVSVITGKIAVSRETKICDLGTGPGLPGFLFYCLREKPDVTLLDSQGRRLKFLQQSSSGLAAKDKLHFVYARAEEHGKQYDLVVSRSFVPYPFSAELALRMIKKNGYYIPFLGNLFLEDDVEAEYLRRLGLELEETCELEKLSFLGKRHIKLLKKTGKPVHGYPRPWKTITKEIQKYNGQDHINQ